MKNIKFNSPIISIPDNLKIIDKKGNIKSIKTLTKNNNLSSNNKLKSIQLKINKNDEFLIISKGDTIIETEKLKMKNEINKIKDIINELKLKKNKNIDDKENLKILKSNLKKLNDELKFKKNKKIEPEPEPEPEIKLTYKEKLVFDALNKVKKFIDEFKDNKKINSSIKLSKYFNQLKNFYNKLSKIKLSNVENVDRILLLNYYNDMLFLL